jgi:hypothetical protein
VSGRPKAAERPAQQLTEVAGWWERASDEDRPGDGRMRPSDIEPGDPGFWERIRERIRNGDYIVQPGDDQYPRREIIRLEDEKAIATLRFRRASKRINDLEAKRAAQQSGNEKRRVHVLDDAKLAEASARHLNGEKWDAIAPDYGYTGRGLRGLLKKKGLSSRGKR